MNETRHNVKDNRARTENIVYKNRVFEGSGSTLGYPAIQASTREWPEEGACPQSILVSEPEHTDFIIVQTDYASVECGTLNWCPSVLKNRVGELTVRYVAAID